MVEEDRYCVTSSRRSGDSVCLGALACACSRTIPAACFRLRSGNGEAAVDAPMTVVKRLGHSDRRAGAEAGLARGSMARLRGPSNQRDASSVPSLALSKSVDRPVGS
jgi:hypothetical protein